MDSKRFTYIQEQAINDITLCVLADRNWRDNLSRSRDVAIRLLVSDHGSEEYRQYAFETLLAINAYGI